MDKSRIVAYSPKWDIRFLDLAKHISGWSKDPSTKVGAVIVDDDRNVLSLGYNGFPRGIQDRIPRLQIRKLKYELMVHGEMNAIYNATSKGVSLTGSTIYIHGLFVCEECAKGIIQVGIKRVVVELKQLPQRWVESCRKALDYFNEAGVDHIAIEM